MSAWLSVPVCMYLFRLSLKKKTGSGFVPRGPVGEMVGSTALYAKGCFHT